MNGDRASDSGAAEAQAPHGFRLYGILGTEVPATDYAGLISYCTWRATQPGCVAIECANTHILTMRRHEPEFRDLTSEYDFFIPDATPLVWCLNWQGAGLKDRVYGPVFMHELLSRSPGSVTHYLLGGGEELGARLRDEFARVNPGIKFVGGFHGKCGTDGRLEGSADQAVIDEINRLSPDIIWVGLGTPKQQGWVKHHKHLLKRGVVLTVGFAFDVNAGMKPDAPPWMQRLGLTWLFRLASEPRRLLGRYFKYNSLFLLYLLLDGLRGRAFAKSA